MQSKIKKITQVIFAFVILTNPLFAQKAHIEPDYRTLIAVNYPPGCKRIEPNGRYCKEAILVFKEVRVSSEPKNKGKVDVVFKRPSDGQWWMTVRFWPSQCELVRTKHSFNSNPQFHCRDVFWIQP